MAAEDGGRVVAVVGREGAAIPLARFVARAGGGRATLLQFLRALTVTEKALPGAPKGAPRAVRQAYTLTRDHLVVPRAKLRAFAATRNGAGLALIDEARGGADALPPPRRLAPEARELAAPMYEYQEAAVEHLCGAAGVLGPASVAAHRGVAYLQMDTGLGKSRVGIAVVAERGEPALVVAPTVAIARQWLDEAAELCPGMRAALYQNPAPRSRRPPPGPATHDLVVVVVNTLREKPAEFMEGYGTFVLDEAHEYHSRCNSRVLDLAQTGAVLALSATPLERPDGLDRFVVVHLGPLILPAAIPGFDTGAVNFRGEVRVVEYVGHPAHCATAVSAAGTTSAIGTIGNVIQDPHRMRLVAAEAHRLSQLHATAAPAELARLGLGPRPEAAATPTHPAGDVRRHGVFVFAEHREYLPALREALAELVGPDGVLAPELSPVSILRGGAARDAVRDARRAGAHIVLVTYGFGRRGLSLPEMTAMVFATPRRNGMRQLLGRIGRRGSDESILRQVVDLVDRRTGLRGQAADRRKVYHEKGWPVGKAAARWTDYPAPLPAGAPPPAGADAAAPGEGAEDGEPGSASEPDELEGLPASELAALALGRLYAGEGGDAGADDTGADDAGADDAGADDTGADDAGADGADSAGDAGADGADGAGGAGDTNDAGAGALALEDVGAPGAR